MSGAKKNIENYYWLIAAIALVVLLNIFSNYFHVQLDLTEDKKHTLTPATEEIVKSIDGSIFIQVLLEGKFPAEFKRLPTAIKELLDKFQKMNRDVQFRFEDPLFGETDEVNERLESWAQVGIVPIELNVRDADGQSKQRIYPFAIFNYGDRQIAIRLLEENTPGMSGDLALNNSISLLEYKFANAITKLQAVDKPNILFSSGHGELLPVQTAAFEGNLRAFYNTGRVDLDTIYQIPPSIDMLIVAKPTIPFSDKHLFLIDQYIVNGGRAIFLIDPLVVNLDSISKSGQYIPHDNELGLEDMFFKYGVRINKNFVLDMQCTSIPLGINSRGSKSQFNLFPWYYHILATGSGEHPITKGLNPVNLFFPASLDTIKTKSRIIKTPVLQSSDYSRVQVNPVILDFEILKTEPDQSLFNSGRQNLALLLEGSFASVFENRVTPQMQDVLNRIGTTFKAQSDPSKILVVADGDVAKNGVNPNTGELRQLGFNQYMNYTFDNKDFLTNAIEYMLDRNGLIAARAKTFKLRLLDQPRIERERVRWQLINVVLPLMLLILVGVLFNYLRRRRFA